jgi:hypothetical protein
MPRNAVETRRRQDAQMASRVLSVFLAAGLAACDGAAVDYSALVEEDCLVVSSVEAVLALPALPPEQKI